LGKVLSLRIFQGERKQCLIICGSLPPSLTPASSPNMNAPPDRFFALRAAAWSVTSQVLICTEVTG
jgi:hypothetical protein